MYIAESVDKIEQAIADIEPKGWKLLVILPVVKGTTSGGVLLPDAAIDAEQIASCVGMVAKIGPQAYADPARFPEGPWCKDGDWVVFKSYSGNRLKSVNADIELRLINDDSIEAVVTDPAAYKRI